MHERALVSALAARLAGQAASDRVSCVTLSLSPDTDPDVVREAWRAVTRGTPIAGASLELVTEQHALLCLDCGDEYDGGKLTPCPECGGNGLVVTAAPEVALSEWVTGLR